MVFRASPRNGEFILLELSEVASPGRLPVESSNTCNREFSSCNFEFLSFKASSLLWSLRVSYTQCVLTPAAAHAEHRGLPPSHWSDFSDEGVTRPRQLRGVVVACNNSVVTHLASLPLARITRDGGDFALFGRCIALAVAVVAVGGTKWLRFRAGLFRCRGGHLC